MTSLGAHGQTSTVGGTSVAAPFVTGAVALVWSQLPAATEPKFAWRSIKRTPAGEVP